MDTIAAIHSMANDPRWPVTNDEPKTPGAAAFHKRFPDIYHSVDQAISVLDINGMNPDSDRATQQRLAAAVDRQIVGAEIGAYDYVDTTKRILSDYNLQEVAAQRLTEKGQLDPLRDISSPDTERNDKTMFSSILSRNGISANVIFNNAQADDIAAIAEGRYDKIKADFTRFAVASVLRLSDEQMQGPGRNKAEKVTPIVRPAREGFPAGGIGRGPHTMAEATAFGRKQGAER